MKTVILKDLCVLKKVTKKKSFYDLAKNHIVKSNDKNKNLSLDVDKILYEL